MRVSSEWVWSTRRVVYRCCSCVWLVVVVAALPLDFLPGLSASPTKEERKSGKEVRKSKAYLEL